MSKKRVKGKEFSPSFSQKTPRPPCIARPKPPRNRKRNMCGKIPSGVYEKPPHPKTKFRRAEDFHTRPCLLLYEVQHCLNTQRCAVMCSTRSMRVAVHHGISGDNGVSAEGERVRCRCQTTTRTGKSVSVLLATIVSAWKAEMP